MHGRRCLANWIDCALYLTGGSAAEREWPSHAWQMSALMGPSGAGKSTLLDILAMRKQVRLGRELCMQALAHDGLVACCGARTMVCWCAMILPAVRALAGGTECASGFVALQTCSKTTGLNAGSCQSLQAMLRTHGCSLRNTLCLPYFTAVHVWILLDLCMSACAALSCNKQVKPAILHVSSLPDQQPVLPVGQLLLLA